MFYAYIYRDPRTNVPFYVGKGSKKRAWFHLSRKDDSHMARKVRKLLAENVKPSIEVISALNEDHAYFLESCLIECFGRQDLGTGTLTNNNNGGWGSTHPSPEIRAKMSASHRGIKKGPLSESARRKLSQAKFLPSVLEGRKKQAQKMTGRTASPETKAKMAASQKARREAERASS